MSEITLRNIPPKLEEAIRRRAGADRLSLDETVIRMLEEAQAAWRSAAARQGAEQVPAVRELHHDLDHLAGTWSDEEATAFEEALLAQRRVETELWD